MSPVYHIAREEGLMSVRVQSPVELVELQGLAGALLESDEYEPELPLLVDLRGMRLELNREDLQPFNRYMVGAFQNRGASTAVVIDCDMSQKLSAAIYWLACAVGDTEVFDDYDHALKWLIRREFAVPAVAAGG